MNPLTDLNPASRAQRSEHVWLWFKIPASAYRIYGPSTDIFRRLQYGEEGDMNTPKALHRFSSTETAKYRQGS